MNLFQFYLDNPELHSADKRSDHFFIYDRYLSTFINKTVTLIEINAKTDGLAKMWRRYFGPLARIINLEAVERSSVATEDSIYLRFGSLNSAQFLKAVIDEFGVPDIIIDNGCRLPSDIVLTFETLYPRLSRNGVYLVDNVFTSYWQEFGGSVRTGQNFIDYVKELGDELHADSTRGRIPPTAFSVNTLAIHIYNGMVVIERGERPRHLL
jgi:hypothetical protein